VCHLFDVVVKGLLHVILSTSGEALDQMGTAVRFNNAADLPDLEGTRRVFEGFHHFSRSELTEVATLTVRSAVAALESSLLKRDLPAGDLLVPHQKLLDGLVSSDIGSGLVGPAGHRIAAPLVLDQQVCGANLSAHLEIMC
jgi:hypothetical protein